MGPCLSTIIFFVNTSLGATPNEDAAGSTDAASAALIRQAVDAHGLRDPDGLEIGFSFRGTPYRLYLDGPSSRYERDVATDAGPRRDVLEGWTLTSRVGDMILASDDDEVASRRRSLNSVAYFALLPRPLEDEAVIAISGGRQTLKGKDYEVVDVRFHEDGGGEDHDDRFRYWFDPDTHRIAYLAYTYARGGGGVRVRAVTAVHEVDGVVLFDYANHGLDGPHTLEDLDAALAAFEAGTLPRVSMIEVDSVVVNRH